MGVVGPVEPHSRFSFVLFLFFPFSPMCSPRVVNRAILYVTYRRKGGKKKGGPGSFLSSSETPFDRAVSLACHTLCRLKAVATVKKLIARAKKLSCLLDVFLMSARSTPKKSLNRLAKGNSTPATVSSFEKEEILFFFFLSFLILNHSFDFRSFSFRSPVSSHQTEFSAHQRIRI